MNAGSVFSFWLGLRRLGRSDSIDLVVPMALSFLWPRLSAELAVAFVSSFSRSGLPFGLVVSCRSRRSVVFVVLLVSSPGRVRRSVGLVVPTDLFFPHSSFLSYRPVGFVVLSVRRSVGTGRVCAYSQHNLVSSSLHGLTAEAEHAQGMMHFPKASNVNCAGEVFC